MDPSLMAPEEIEARGRVVIDPCQRCHHNRQAHLYIPRFDMVTGYLTIPVTACVVCECSYFVDDDG